jgi:putative mycofactocin binding protein MftB
MIKQSDTTNPKSLRGVGPYGPYGPEAQIPILKLSTEAHSASKLPRALQSCTRFKCADGVQVRAGTFGLLFYNYRGPRLYFVPSKDLIDVDFFNGHLSVSGLIASTCARKGWTKTEVEEKITQVLANLEDKGLINGQPIC